MKIPAVVLIEDYATQGSPSAMSPRRGRLS